MKIIVDFDSTLVATHFAVLDLYRELTGDFSTEVDDATVKWNMENACPLWDAKKVNEVFSNVRFFELLKPFNNAVEVLKKLKNDGHHITICSMHKKEGIQLKKDYINKVFPFVDEVVILPTDDAAHGKFNKSSVDGDVIIDDRIDCVKSSPAKWKIVYGAYTWNENWKDLRVCNWINLYSLINEIEFVERNNAND